MAPGFTGGQEVFSPAPDLFAPSCLCSAVQDANALQFLAFDGANVAFLYLVPMEGEGGERNFTHIEYVRWIQGTMQNWHSGAV